MLECVANVSEGRDRSVLETLAKASGRELLDLHTDVDHHRSVFTIADEDSDRVFDATERLATAVAELVSIEDHAGVHPRFGALDVVPFAWLTSSARGDAIARAHGFARWWAETFEVPVFLYAAADEEQRDLPVVRRDAFGRRAPDHGPPEPHPRLGATAVGARQPLVAVNCELATDHVAIASAIATRVRERDGGLPGVRALGFPLDEAGCAQVSMNLTDLAETGIEQACTAVRTVARAVGTDVTRVEIVGLLPQGELDRCSPEFLAWSGLTSATTIEGRLTGRD